MLRKNANIILHNDNRIMLNDNFDSNLPLKFIGVNYGNWGQQLSQNLLYILEKYSSNNVQSLIGLSFYNTVYQNTKIKIPNNEIFTMQIDNTNSMCSLGLDDLDNLYFVGPNGKESIYSENSFTKKASSVGFKNNNQLIFYKITNQLQQAIDNFVNNRVNSILFCNLSKRTSFDTIPTDKYEDSAIFLKRIENKKLIFSANYITNIVSSNFDVEEFNRYQHFIIKFDISAPITINLFNFTYVSLNTSNMMYFYNKSNFNVTIKATDIDGKPSIILKARENLKILAVHDNNGKVTYEVFDDKKLLFSPIEYHIPDLPTKFTKYDMDFKTKENVVTNNKSISIIIPTNRPIKVTSVMNKDNAVKYYINNMEIILIKGLIIPSNCVLNIESLDGSYYCIVLE